MRDSCKAKLGLNAAINLSSSNYHIFLFHTHIHSGGSRQKCLLLSLFSTDKGAET